MIFLKYHTAYLFQSKIVNWKIKSPYLKKLVLRIPDQGNVFTVLKMFSLELRSVKCFPPICLICQWVSDVFTGSRVSLRYFFVFSLRGQCRQCRWSIFTNSLQLTVDKSQLVMIIIHSTIWTCSFCVYMFIYQPEIIIL